jgi:aspartate oxidase
MIADLLTDVEDFAQDQHGLAKMAKLKAGMAKVDVRPSAEGYQDLAHTLDLRASLLAAEATLLGAIERRESRGAHQHSHYPALDPALKVNFIVTLKNGELVLPRVPADADEQAQLEKARIRRMHRQKIDEELVKMQQETSAT